MSPSEWNGFECTCPHQQRQQVTPTALICLPSSLYLYRCPASFTHACASSLTFWALGHRPCRLGHKGPCKRNAPITAQGPQTIQFIQWATTMSSIIWGHSPRAMQTGVCHYEVMGNQVCCVHVHFTIQVPYRQYSLWYVYGFYDVTIKCAVLIHFNA
jgi:hypothetical protein